MRRTNRNRTWPLFGVAVACGILVVAAWFLIDAGPDGPPRAAAPVRADNAPLATESPPAQPGTVIHANTAFEAGRPRPFTVTAVDADRGTRRVGVTAPDLLQVPNGAGSRLAFKGHRGSMPAGAPNLPIVSTLIPGEPDTHARIAVMSSSYRDISDIDVVPVETVYHDVKRDGTSERRSEQAGDASIYDVDGYWPRELADVTEAWMGTQKWTRVEVRPVQYNPVTRTVRYHESISAELHYEPVGDAALRGLTFASEPEPLPDPFDCPPLYDDPVLPDSPGTPSDFAPRRSGAEVDAYIKIRITGSSGIYKITQAELGAAGVDTSKLVGSDLRVFHRDREVAIHVSTAGLFGPSDYFLFFGEEFVGPNTERDAFWLGFGAGGLRMPAVVSSPLGGANEVTSHFRTVSFAPNTLFADNVGPLNEDWDHWRAAPLFNINGIQIDVVNDSFATAFPVSTGNARLCATLHGVSESESFGGFTHNTLVDINGTSVSTSQWNGTGSFGGSPFRDSYTFPASILTGPTSSFYARQELLPGNTGNDQVALEALDLVYPRELRSIGNALDFRGQTGTNNYTVDGFSSDADLWAFEISDPDRPSLLTAFDTQSTPNGFHLRFGNMTAASERYYVAREISFKTAFAISKQPFRGLDDTNRQADVVFIVPTAFREQSYRLMTNRYIRGKSVAVASVSDVMDEFGYGVRDAAAIRQFLGFTFHHWQDPPPQCVVLVGDGTFDPNLFATADASGDRIPAHLGGTPFNYTALDPWFVRVNGTNAFGEPDILADMAVGRIPVRSNAALKDVVDKILLYEALPTNDVFRKRGMVAAGSQQGAFQDFIGSADIVRDFALSHSFTNVNRQYAGAGGSNAGVLLNLNQTDGRFFAAYFGHGADFLWNLSPILLQNTDVASLTNVRLPIVTATTCWNGFFLKPADGLGSECLAEVLVEWPVHGAIASIAGTALSQNPIAGEIAIAFHESLLNETTPVRTLGEAMMGGYLGGFETFGTASELTFYTIFGDPALIVNP